MTDHPCPGTACSSPPRCPSHDDLSVDHDAYAEHCAWLVANGCDGVVPNGSLGEYQTLTPEERARGRRDRRRPRSAATRVMPGVAAYGAPRPAAGPSRPREAGCRAVMLLPPNAYRADERTVVAHYREVARAGLPVVAYNNPIDTKVDLTPALLARLHGEGRSSGSRSSPATSAGPTRSPSSPPAWTCWPAPTTSCWSWRSPGRWAGSPDSPTRCPPPASSLYRAAVAGDLATAAPLYRELHPLLRWDSKPEFVQAIKLSMDLAGRRGGPCRPPRVPLLPEQEAAVRAATEKALAAGLA